MSKTQKHVLSLIMLVVIIIVIILILILGIRQGKISSSQYKEPDNTIREIESKISLVKEKSEFYVVRDCINKFYTYSAIVSYPEEFYDSSDEQRVHSIKKENSKIVYNMLAKEYLEYKGITEDNIITKLAKVHNSIVDINSMYMSEKSTDISIYIVNGTLRQRQTSTTSQFEMLVKLDFVNQTFNIILEDYIDEKYPNLTLGGTIGIDETKEIEANINNKYIFNSISDTTYVGDLFNQYKEEIMYNQKLVYDNLDEEYRKTKFSNIEEFREYIKNRYDNIDKLNLESFNKTRTENYTQYTVLDKNGDYYIFRETSPMQYTLILDTYTIDIPEFITRYNDATPQEKVILDINKFMQSLNNKDYKYAYSILADSFKERNFQTLDSFETYAKSNFFEINKFEYKEFADEANTYYTYKVSIKNKESTKEITKTFIILLEEGTKFQLSFNI